MRTIYFRPGMPIVESGHEMSRLYEWFGEQNGIEIRMNDFTFTQILYRININPNNKPFKILLRFDIFLLLIDFPPKI